MRLGKEFIKPDNRLSVTGERKLLVTWGFRDVCDYSLIGGHPGNRGAHAQQLQAYLKGRLPAPAYEEAAQIVRHYLAYMPAHDEMLTRAAIPQLAARRT